MAAGITYVPIATNTLASATTSVTFSSISGSYTDLVLIVNGGIASGAQDIWVQLNSDTGTNYSRSNMYGSGSASGATVLSNQTKMGMDDAAALDAAYQYAAEFHFMNYSNTSTYKTYLKRGVNGARGSDISVGLWRSTSAISTIYVYNSGGTNFVVGSTFTLYGIASA